MKVDNFPNLDVVLKRKGISKTELAEMLGISTTALYSYISGNPTMDSIQRVADVLQIPIFELFSISTRNDKLSDKSEITCPCCGRKLKIDVNLRLKG